MSYTLLKRVTPNGVVESTEWELRNSHGWSAFIYNALTGEYLEPGDPNAWLLEDDVTNCLWRLVGDERLAPFERIVLAMTFDLVWTSATDVLYLPDFLRAFHRKHGRSGLVCHLPEIARVIETEWPVACGLAFYGMSVASDQWRVNEECSACGQTTDEDRDFDMRLDEGASMLDLEALESCLARDKFIEDGETKS